MQTCFQRERCGAKRRTARREAPSVVRREAPSVVRREAPSAARARARLRAFGAHAKTSDIAKQGFTTKYI